MRDLRPSAAAIGARNKTAGEATKVASNWAIGGNMRDESAGESR